MDSGCPVIVGDGIASFVYTGYNQLMSYGASAYNVALNAFNQLITYHPEQQLVDVNYQFDDTVMGYHRPVVPADFDKELDLTGVVNLHDAPNPTAQRPVFDNVAPALDLTPPSIILPDSPGSLTVPPPGSPPLIDEIVLPGTPDATLPPVPVLNQVLPLPLEPSITLPTFQGIRPDFNIDPPDPDVSFTPVAYTSDLLDAVRAQISTMLQGGTGLPAAVEQALMDRAVAREDESGQRLIREVTDEFATMGFAEPEGVLSIKLMEARQSMMDKRASLSRDIYIKAIDVEIANLRFAVEQGVAIETVLLQNWLQMQTLILESQKFVLQVAIDLTNVRVSIFNAQLDQYKTDAAVYRDLIAGELAKLEIYKAELDAKRLILDINAQEIALYNAQLQAVNTKIEIYKAQLSGVQQIVQINTLKLEGYKTIVEAYAEQVRAYQAEWEGYKAAVEAAGVQAQIYDTSVKAYLGEVQAWATKNQNAVALGQFDIALDASRVEVWRAQLSEYLAQVDTAVKTLQSEVSVYDAQTRIYTAQAAVEQAASESNSRNFELGMKREGNSADIKLKNLELSIRQLLDNSNQLLDAKKAVAAGAGSLASSALSSLHFGATASSALQQGQQCSTNYSFNTELLPDD